MKRIRSLVLLVSFIVAASASFAQVTVQVSFTPDSYYTGTDQQGLAHAQWTFTFPTSDSTYFSFFGKPAASTSAVTLTISGSTGADGTYPLTPAHPFVLRPDVTNTSGDPSAVFGTDNTSAFSSFTFGSLAATGFFVNGAAVATPSIGDPVQASDFDGVVLTWGYFSVTGAGTGTATYYVTRGDVLASGTVPEPSTYAVVIGSAALACVVTSRRKRKPASI